MNIHIREFQEQDRAAIEALNQECFGEERDLMQFTFVAEDENGRVVGYVSGKPVKENAPSRIPAGSLCIGFIATDPSVRKHGIAQRLIETIEASYNEKLVKGQIFCDGVNGQKKWPNPFDDKIKKGALKVCASVHERNRASLSLFRKLGFLSLRKTDFRYPDDHIFGPGKEVCFEKDIILSSPKIKLDVIREGDEDAVIALYNKVYPEKTSSAYEATMRKNLSEAFYVACLWDKAYDPSLLVGTGSVHRKAQRDETDHWVFVGGAVLPSYQGLGLGRLLLETRIRAVKETAALRMPVINRDCKPDMMITEIYPDNKACRSLYESKGFECAEEFEDKGQKVLVYQRPVESRQVGSGPT